MIPKHKKIPSGPSVKEAQKIIAEKKEAAWSIFTQQYGKNFLYQGTLVTCDPEVIELLLMERKHTEKRSIVYRVFYKIIPMAYGLLFMDGPPWQKRLHALMPVFTRPNISSYVSFMHQYLQQIMDPWQSI